MVAMCRTIVAQPVVEEVQTFAEALVRLEERDTAMMRKLLAMHYF